MRIGYTIYMYIQVKLLKGFPAPLLYKVPDKDNGAYKVGTIVQVPLRSTIRPAVVSRVYANKPSVEFEIREVDSIEPFPQDVYYRSFLDQLAHYYHVNPIHFVQRISQFLVQKKVRTEVVQQTSQEQSHSAIQLTEEQKFICDSLTALLQKPSFQVNLLHGVTGSGKTEVYKKLIQYTHSRQKTVILLAPEVSLALQLESILKQTMPDIPICGFHSAVTEKQKKIAWNLLVREQPMLLIGVHLPVLLPIANLGLIIIDEEHEVGYQEKKHPKINSKEAALLRARTANIPILLGSATPSISSLYNVKHKGWKFFQLKKRFAGRFPAIKTVLLTDKRQRKQFWVSKELEYAIQDRLERKEQVIIFLNRRGYSFFVQCSSCSSILSCSACSVSLTLHNDNTLACHYCDFKMPLPNCCPSCKADEHKFLKKGIGTQQVVTILQKMFPLASVARADLDVSSKKNLWKKTIQDFEDGLIDILVGTQTISKGFHFPRVTLVGILWADLNLNIPVYNATERGLQQLIQVAGRAGRQHGAGSDVIVQTMGEHQIFEYIDELCYLDFYTTELAHRKDLAYPPYGRFAEIELKHPNEQVVDAEAQQCACDLMRGAQKNNLELVVLGPAKPPVYKVKHMHMRKIYVKARNMNDIIKIYANSMKSKRGFKSSIFFTPNPLS